MDIPENRTADKRRDEAVAAKLGRHEIGDELRGEEYHAFGGLVIPALVTRLVADRLGAFRGDGVRGPYRREQHER